MCIATGKEPPLHAAHSTRTLVTEYHMQPYVNVRVHVCVSVTTGITYNVGQFEELQDSNKHRLSASLPHYSYHTSAMLGRLRKAAVLMPQVTNLDTNG